MSLLHPKTRTFQRFASFSLYSTGRVQESQHFSQPSWSTSTLLFRWTQRNAKAKLTKSLSEQVGGVVVVGVRAGASKGSMSHLKLAPPVAPHHLLCPGFSPPLTPSCDPFVGEKWSRSLETANYRALTSALLNSKCWGTFQQLTDLRFCECVSICCFIFIEMWVQQRKCLFYRRHKAALPRRKSWLILNAQTEWMSCQQLCTMM